MQPARSKLRDVTDDVDRYCQLAHTQQHSYFAGIYLHDSRSRGMRVIKPMLTSVINSTNITSDLKHTVTFERIKASG